MPCVSCALRADKADVIWRSCFDRHNRTLTTEYHVLQNAGSSELRYGYARMVLLIYEERQIHLEGPERWISVQNRVMEP